MSNPVRFVVSMIFITIICLPALAQETTAPSTPAPSSTVPSNVAPSNAAPKKSNQRPAVAPATVSGEPFDNATVAKMAATCVRFETQAGVIEIEMLAETAPETVRNFLNLVATKAFDTTTFSRVVKGFVVQGGNLSTSEQLTPQLAARARRTILDEPNPVKHERGIISMARSEQPNSATTNFFFLVSDAPHLNNSFAAFARVTRGIEIVDAMNNAPTEGEKPKEPVRLTRAVIVPCSQPVSTTTTQP